VYGTSLILQRSALLPVLTLNSMFARAALLLAPALLLTSPAGADPGSVTLGAKAPPVGTKYAEEKSSSFEMTVEADGKSIPVQMSEKQKKKVEVLATKGDAITKAKITYEIDQKSQKQGTVQGGGASKIEGKTYTLTAGATVEVAGASGPAPAAEAEVVRDREDHFGKPQKIARALAGRTFQLGKQVTLPGAEIGDAFGEDPKMALQALTLTYRGMEGKHAKFDLRMSMAGKQPGNDLKLEVAGKIVIEPTSGEPMDLAVEGTIKQGGKTKIDGKVKMSAHRTM